MSALFNLIDGGDPVATIATIAFILSVVNFILALIQAEGRTR